MSTCVECGAPLERAGEPCAACGASRAPATTNGTSHPRFEDPDGLVCDESPLVQGEAESPPHTHDEPASGPSRAPQPSAPRAMRLATAAPREPRPATFVRRAIALLLDLVLLSVLDAILVWLATTAVVLAEYLTGSRVGGAVDLVRSAGSAGSLTLFVGYFSVLHARSGQTLGKVAMRIEVRAEDGSRIGIVPSVLRTFSYVLSAFLFGAGFLMALLPARRALHDRIAGTRVVAVEDNA